MLGCTVGCRPRVRASDVPGILIDAYPAAISGCQPSRSLHGLSLALPRPFEGALVDLGDDWSAPDALPKLQVRARSGSFGRLPSLQDWASSVEGRPAPPLLGGRQPSLQDWQLSPKLSSRSSMGGSPSFKHAPVTLFGFHRAPGSGDGGGSVPLKPVVPGPAMGKENGKAEPLSVLLGSEPASPSDIDLSCGEDMANIYSHSSSRPKSPAFKRTRSLNISSEPTPGNLGTPRPKSPRLGRGDGISVGQEGQGCRIPGREGGPGFADFKIVMDTIWGPQEATSSAP